ncbi:MAG: 2-C-methyl-D-erythritol 2,4-cyclodiphosphate synthase [Phycisphaeraceae bacterium]|nr:2-C-methyl-D-erythritol 2,4-cyclodiphosphate synthase [Phycisphaeraceae bacterium]
MQNLAESFRIGHGYDLHRLEPVAPAGAGRPLIVGGVRLASEKGPVAHSDGDALLHAITDALLSAAGLPDIGQLYPDSDPKHHSQDSKTFLREAAAKVRDLGWTVVNVDATVILEKPKVSPHKHEMRSCVAAALDVDVSRVGIKGKTHEKVDAVGESRAIEVHAVALLVRQ